MDENHYEFKYNYLIKNKIFYQAGQCYIPNTCSIATRLDLNVVNNK